MKFYTGTHVNSNFVADLEFRVNEPASGFSFAFGSGTGAGDFTTGLSFRGSGGYLFDQSGNFFGGYRSGELFNVQVHSFDFERASYFYDGVLMSNHIEIICPINCIEFEKYGSSTMGMRIKSQYVEPPTINTASGLQDSNLEYLVSFDGFYLIPNE